MTRGGGLPLLQFALWRLWESRPRRLDFINESQVARLPNVVAALGTAAEEQYEALTPRMREVCQRLSWR